MRDENVSINSAQQVHRQVLSKFNVFGIRNGDERSFSSFILAPSSFLNVRAGTGEYKDPRNASRFRQFR